MSKSQSKIPSPARSQGVITPRRPRTRRTRSVASPARSEMSGRLSSVVEKFVKDDFVLSPMRRRSVLPDDTEIEAPRRASWWKRLEGSSRDVLEALDTNKMTDDLLVEDYEFEVEKDKQNQSVPESSDNESVASIVVPQRRLFNQKKQPQGKFADILGSQKSLGKTNIEDQSIEDAPKNLFNKGPRNKPIFPAALLNSTNKTINKTVEPEPTKQARPNLFGQAGTKRKNMFTDFVLSDSEEDSEVHHKVFGFQRNNNKRISLGTRNRRMPSLTPSMTTEIDIDDWNLLPSSTMIGAQEVSRMSSEVVLVQEENQDDTLTEENESLNLDINNLSTLKNGVIENDENDKTLTNDDIEEASKNQDMKNNESKKSNKTHQQSKTTLNESIKDKSLRDKSSARDNARNVAIIEEIAVEKQQINASTINQITVMKEQSLEDKIAELHGESADKEESRPNLQLDNTKENYKETKTEHQHTDDKGEKERKSSAEEQEVQNISKAASSVSLNKDDGVPEKDKSEEELEQSNEGHKNLNDSKKGINTTQDEDMGEVSEKNKSGGDTVASIEEQGSQEQSKEESIQDEDMENESEEEIEPSAEEQETDAHSEAEEEDTNQDEDTNDMTEKDKSEPSANDEDNQNETNEETHENEDEEMVDVSEKDKSDEIDASAHNKESQNYSKEESHENQDEDMEEMVWNDNDDEKASDTSEAEINAEAEQNDVVVPDQKANKTGENDKTHERKEITNKSRNLSSTSHKIVESSLDNDQIEEDVVDETPNNSTHDTTGRNRKQEATIVKSPEAVLQNMTNENESFRPIGRSTTFRKSKSVYEMMNRSSLALVQESTLGSEGSRNSSTEGSEWDSHRTTRKTIRQTLGKEYTTRKSLRALIMEQSAKRQTELYDKNTANINKTKNKTALEGNDKNASKMNKSKNKTISEEANKTAAIDKTKNKSVSEDKNASTINKTKNKTVLEDVNNENASTMNKTKNKTVLEDINDQHIRFRRTSNRSISSNQSPISKSPVHRTSTHHVPDPLISEHQVSYHKSLHDMKDPEISEQMSNREDSISIPMENNDSGPEISMNASYGQGMSADTVASDIDMKDNSGLKFKEVSRRNASVRAKSIHNSDQEILDYEVSEIEKSEQELSHTEDEEHLEQDSVQESVQDEEKENSEPEESENEESEKEIEDFQQEIEAESEQGESQQEMEAESDNEESQQEIESEQEECQQQIEAESEHEESQQEIESEQEIEAESEHEESQQEIESEQEISEAESEHEQSQQEIESEQEIEAESENEESQQEIESEQEESQQEIEPDSEEESDNEQDMSQPESDQELSREPERDSDDNDLVSGLHSQTDNRFSRVVFDSQMMSVEEFDFEGGSRHTSNISKQSEKEPELSMLRVSEPSVHEVSVGTKKSMLLLQMQKIAQQNMELRQKIRDRVQKSLKPTRNCNIMSPVPKYSIRRMTKEPRQAKQPKPTGVPRETLPKAFVEDLMYKPPKRFQPANAPWITKRLYKFLETKLEPKYDYRARVRAEELVQTIHSFAKLVRRRDAAPAQAVDELKKEMARLRVVNTHYEFYEFFHEFMPREVRIKVNPDVVNNIPMPRNGVFGDILPPRTALE